MTSLPNLAGGSGGGGGSMASQGATSSDLGPAAVARRLELVGRTATRERPSSHTRPTGANNGRPSSKSRRPHAHAMARGQREGAAAALDSAPSPAHSQTDETKDQYQGLLSAHSVGHSAASSAPPSGLPVSSYSPTQPSAPKRPSFIAAASSGGSAALASSKPTRVLESAERKTSDTGSVEWVARCAKLSEELDFLRRENKALLRENRKATRAAQTQDALLKENARLRHLVDNPPEAASQPQQPQHLHPLTPLSHAHASAHTHSSSSLSGPNSPGMPKLRFQALRASAAATAAAVTASSAYASQPNTAPPRLATASGSVAASPNHFPSAPTASRLLTAGSPMRPQTGPHEHLPSSATRARRQGMISAGQQVMSATTPTLPAAADSRFASSSSSRAAVASPEPPRAASVATPPELPRSVEIPTVETPRSPYHAAVEEEEEEAVAHARSRTPSPSAFRGHTPSSTVIAAPSSLSLPRQRLSISARPFTPLAPPITAADSLPPSPQQQSHQSQPNRRDRSARQKPFGKQSSTKQLVFSSQKKKGAAPPPPASDPIPPPAPAPSPPLPQASPLLDDEVSLVYDPILQCYYAPESNQYYQLHT